MNFYISPIERLVLESISKSAKNIFELIDDTKIKKEVVSNILQSLLVKNIIIFEKKRYRIVENLNQELIQQLRNDQNMLVEVSQIVKLTIKKSLNTQDSSFKYKKVFMGDDEEKIFKALLYQLESYIESLQSKRGQTYQQKIIFWGSNNYESLTHDMLSSY